MADDILRDWSCHGRGRGAVADRVFVTDAGRGRLLDVRWFLTSLRPLLRRLKVRGMGKGL